MEEQMVVAAAQVNEEEDESVELNNNTAEVASIIRSVSIGVGPNKENNVNEHNLDDGDEANNNNNNNNNTITNGEQQQQQQPLQPSSHSQHHTVAIGVPLSRAYLAGIPPAKPYRRITYTEWTTSSPLSSESIAISLQDVQDMEKKVKTNKCMLISCLLSMACYTFCFFIIPILVYICYIIVYVTYIDQQEAAAESGETFTLLGTDTSNSVPPALEDIDEVVPCPYALQIRNLC